MNKFPAVLCLVLITSINSEAQYFYKDIISNKQLAAEMQLYKEKKVRNIKLKSFESDGEPSKGFFCERKISKDFRKSELFTKSEMSATSLFTSVFDDKGNLLSSSDSSQISVTHNFYSYDASGRIVKIVSTVRSSDDDFTDEITEEHIYEYDNEVPPTSMIMVKNRRDSIRILFMNDENGNVSLEKNTKDGSKYYYYYDSKKQLTDVVHANEYRERLVAVYLFEYNSAGQLSQMTTTEEGRNNFFIWRYRYDNDLRAEERLLSKDRKLIGRIEYEY